MLTDSFISLSSTELSSVSGGEGGFEAFADRERSRVADQYKQIVCAGAGVKGGQELAKGVYGPNASDPDKIRAAEVLKSYCLGGSQLPAAAPKSPF